MEPGSNLNLFPSEIITQFLIRLSPKDLANYCQTSKAANVYCQSDAFWKDKYRYDYGLPLPVLIEGKKWIDVYKIKASKVTNYPMSEGWVHYGIIDDQGNLYTGGDNRWGQLGNGTAKPTKIPFRMKLLQKVISVACGTANTIAITEDGKTYGWGKDIYIRAGSYDYNGLLTKPTEIKYLVENPQNPNSRAQGWVIDTKIRPEYISWQITSPKATKASYGASGWGVIFDDSSAFYSIDKEMFMEHIAGMITLESGIRDISTSSAKFAMVSRNGKLYMFGTNFDGEFIGIKKGSLQVEPTEIPLQKKIKQVSLSSYNILVLTEKGKVYTWGRTIIDPPTTRLDMIPKKISRLSKISHITTHDKVMAAVSTDGKLYMWGKISYKGRIDFRSIYETSVVRISRYTRKPYIALPEEIDIGHKVKYVAVGRKFSIAATEDGVVNYWGNPRYGPS